MLVVKNIMLCFCSHSSDPKAGGAANSGLPDVTMRSPTTSNPASPAALSLFQPMPPPAPGHITDSELDVLQRCLRRWRTEVESDVTGRYRVTQK